MKQIMFVLVAVVVFVSCEVPMDYAKDLPYDVREPTLQINSLRHLQMVVNSIPYARDQEVYGKRDYWAAPQEFLDKGRGDCEDFAIFVVYYAEKLGYKARLVKIDNGDNTYHAAVTIDGVLYEPQNMCKLYLSSKRRIIETYTLDECLSICYNTFGSRNVVLHVCD